MSARLRSSLIPVYESVSLPVCPSLVRRESFLISGGNWVTVWAIANYQMHSCTVVDRLTD